MISPEQVAGFRRGDFVVVRSLEEILATLDAEGKLDGLPFMPEMARWCGQRLKVHRLAGKPCVEGFGFRRMQKTVFLEGARCDGSAHDGCQRHCLIFWKEAWLKPVESAAAADADGYLLRAASTPSGSMTAENGSGPLPPPKHLPTIAAGRYICQSTELGNASSALTGGNLQHYLEDLRNNELSPGRLLRFLARGVLRRLRRICRLPVPGTVAGTQAKPPKGDLGLRPGDWVEVKSRAEIETTLDPAGKNRGLSFEQEMLEHCGRRYRVAFPVRKIIAEETGKMVKMTNTVVLDGVTCQGLCTKNCPRSNCLYWREIWLRRV